MKKINKYRILHNLVILYLLAAFAWWAILLNKKNKEIYDHKMKTAETEAMVAKLVNKPYDYQVNVDQIETKYEKQTKMIIGEGLVFGLSILIGLVLINRAFLSELKLNRQLNDFLLSVTHELKTPIASLKLATQTLKRKNLPSTQQEELIQTNWEECLRLEAQVNNMLTAAQIEQSYKFNFEKTEISGLLSERINRLQKVFPTREIEFNYLGEPIFLNVDREAITKTIDNIVHNALKYSKDNNSVEIELAQNNGSASIRIKDQGIGIKDSEKSKIWSKFYRSENEDTRETQGTGLGLWIAKNVIEAHKGKIKVLDNKPQGSIFELNLPIR